MKKIFPKSYKKQIGDIPKDLLNIAALVFCIWTALIIYKLGGLFWLGLVFLFIGIGVYLIANIHAKKKSR